MKNFTQKVHPTVARAVTMSARLNGANLINWTAPTAAHIPVAVAMLPETKTQVVASVSASIEATAYDENGTFTDFGAPWHGTPATLESVLHQLAKYDASRPDYLLPELPMLPEVHTHEQKRALGRARSWWSVLTDTAAFHEDAQIEKFCNFYLEAHREFMALAA